MITKRERLILAILKAIATVEGWDGVQPSVDRWRLGDPVPSKTLRKEIAFWERYYKPKA